MNDFENEIGAALDSHATGARTGTPPIDQIWQRVDRRRQRRRMVAGVGSAAVVVLGVGAIMSLGGQDAAPLASGSPDTGFATTTMPAVPYTVGPSGNAWRCTGALGYDPNQPEASYFTSCELSTIPPEIYSPLDPAGVPTTSPLVCWAPPTTAPAGANQGDVAITVLTDTSCQQFETAPPTTATGIPISPVEQYYTVFAGDSLYSIAAMFGIDPQLIADYNVWPDGIDHAIMVGDLVRIPPNAVDRTLPPLPTTTTSTQPA